MGLPARLTSVTIVGPYNRSGPGDTTEPTPDFCLQPRCASTRSRLRQDHPRVAGATRLSRHADAGQPAGAASTSIRKGAPTAGPSSKASSSRCGGCWSAPSSSTASKTNRSRPDREGRRRTASSVYKINDLELASRLSFFLWSSIPDDELLDVASRGAVSNADVLEQAGEAHARRPAVGNIDAEFRRAVAAGSQHGDRQAGRAYSLAFDETLRQSMQRETELFSTA
jgi:hypothetical protein